MTTPEQAEFQARSDDVDRLLATLSLALGGSRAHLYDLEEAVAAREAARIRTLPGFPHFVRPEKCADHIDPDMRRRAGQEPMTVHPLKPAAMAVLLQLHHGSNYVMDVRPAGDHDRIDTLVLSPDNKVTIRYGVPAQPSTQPVPPPTPPRARLIAHIDVPRHTTAIRAANIRSYPWEDLT